MSDLFMNKLRRRHQRWHQQQQPATTADATASASSSFTAAKKTSRSTRAGTPGAIKASLNANYFGYDFDNDSDDIEYVEKPQHQQEEAPNNEDYDPLSNILSLKLRKPNHWKWELTTSKSCSNIALPRILLYDHKGNLLVDAPPGGGEANSEQIYKQEDHEQPRPQDKATKRPYNHHRAATTNLTHSVRKALEKEFDGLQIEEVPPTPRKNSTFTYLSTTPSSNTATTTIRNRSRSHSRKPIDLNIGDLPDSSPRSSSLKGVRFNVDHDSKIPDFLPTPPSTTTPTSSSSGPREKRKYRRSHSSGRLSSRSSNSILERLSYQKGRFSSPESEDEEANGEDNKGPRYFLRTDEAGTLIVHQDSSSSQNSRRPRRKPQKYLSSGDSINKLETPPKLSLSPTIFDAGSPLSEASITASTKERRRKLLPVRRLLSDNNVLLLSKDKFSSEEEEEQVEKKQSPKTVITKQEPKKEIKKLETTTKTETDKPTVITNKEETKKDVKQLEETKETNPIADEATKKELEKKLVKLIEPEPAVAPTGGCNCVHHRRYKRNETKDLNTSISSVGHQRNGKIR
ncbi:uncharacterized protein [Musca autumnalis]|uniref:uncharacterized protein n=1 Tax=Musca autumnalis TaxID=221902 RepID=UPI003CF5E7EA